MKIEVNCSDCKSLLRVDERHAGKQVRCPSCGSLSNIPFDENSDGRRDADDASQTKSEQFPQTHRPTSAPLYRPDVPAGFSSGPNAEYPRGDDINYRDTQPTDGKDTTAMILGGLAIGSVFVCGCFSIIVTPALSITGFVLARSSNGPSRSGAMVTNFVALMLWILSSLFWIIAILAF